MNTFKNGLLRLIAASACCLAFSTPSFAQEAAPTAAYDSNVQYVMGGKAVAPWELSLNFGKEVLTTLPAETAKGSLIATSATKTKEGDAIHLKWSPKGLKNEWGTDDKNVMTVNLTNKQAALNLSSIQNDAALVVDIRIIKAPKDLVELTMECNWDWKCRSSLQLKSVFKKLPKNEWVSLPLPLQCFAKDDFDFSKVTSTFMLQTSDKMEIELGDIRLAAFPADQAKC